MTDIDILIPNSIEDDDSSSLKDNNKVETEKVEKEELPYLPKCSTMYLLLKLYPFWLIIMPLSWIAPFYIINTSQALNPCNATNPQIFQSFVTEWKLKNETVNDLNYWKNIVNYSDIPEDTKRYFEQKIQASTLKIEALNATLNLQYQIYENCFHNNVRSKLNIIYIYWTAAYLIFAIGAILIHFSIKKYRNYLEANKNLYNAKVLADLRSGEHATDFFVKCCILVPVLTYMLLCGNMEKDMQTEFII